MRIGILQPGYLPWLGFFEQMFRSDVFVLYDDVQYDKDGWRNRNRIKTANGIQWLTVPAIVKFQDRPLVREVRIDNKQNWRKKHLFSIRQNYAKAPFFEQYIGMFEEAYMQEWELLVDLNRYFISRLAEAFGMKDKKILMSSDLQVKGDRIDRLIAICRMFKADVFYEGESGREYIETERFAEQGITVEFQNYRHPVYRQLYGAFVPYLSAIDLLFNHGPEGLSILTEIKAHEEAMNSL